MLVVIQLCVLFRTFLAVTATLSVVELQSVFRASLAAQGYIFAATSTTGSEILLCILFLISALIFLPHLFFPSNLSDQLCHFDSVQLQLITWQRMNILRGSTVVISTIRYSQYL